MSEIKKVVLAYSGGLDTSVILKWLQDTYHCEVVTFTADIGQGEELEPARAKALKIGIKPENIFIDDLREEFVRDFVFPMFRANTVYEGEYLLGTSIARPLIAKRLIEIAAQDRRAGYRARRDRQGQRPGAFRTGRLCAEPEHQGHRAMARMGSAVARKADGLCREGRHPDRHETQARRLAIFDGREPAAHLAIEGRHLEDPAAEAEESMWRWTVSPEKAPDDAEYLDIEFIKGDIVALNGTKMPPAQVLAKLNELGGKHGIGRLDLVENRYVGMKSRGCYETPGGTIMLKAHRAIESITLDREVAHLKDDLMPRYAAMIYNGYWWSPERKALAGADRPHAAECERLGARQAVQGQRDRRRTRLQDRFAVRPGHRHIRGRQGRIRPEGRRGFHQAERVADAHRCQSP